MTGHRKFKLSASNLAAGLFVLVGCLAAPGLLAQASLPDVVLITIDTLRSDRLGSYGYAPARTPNLDRLAQQGVRFENAFSTVPLTLPAHASLMTGTYPPWHGIRDNSGYALEEQHQTLAEVLKSQGYATAAFIGAFVLDSRFGLDQGFDVYFDAFDATGGESISPDSLQRPADQVIDPALEWLGIQSGPVFLWVHLYDPHDPYQPPAPFSARHPGRPYDGEIEFTDAQIGRLLDQLQTWGRYDNSLIIGVGDHGEGLGEHQEQTHGFFVYNSTLKVPLIVKMPGGSEAGRVVSENVSLVDLLPTVTQVLRIEQSAAPAVQGAGLLRLILGKAEASDRPLYAETYYPHTHFGWSPLITQIQGKRKLIEAPAPELYDLASDPHERSDLSGQNSALVNQMSDRLKVLLSRVSAGDSAVRATTPLDPETAQKLQSLGYVASSAPLLVDLQGRKDLIDPKERIGVYNRLGQIDRLNRDGDLRGAVKGYRSLLEEHPEMRIAHTRLAQLLVSLNDLQGALEHFQRAVQLGGPEGLNTFNLALTYLRLGRFEEAQLGFERTLQLDPHHERAAINLAVIYKNQGRRTEAIGLLRKVLQETPVSVPALSNLGVLLALEGQPGEAAELLIQAVTLNPDDARLHANLSQVYRALGKIELADLEMEKARSLDPSLFKPRP